MAIRYRELFEAITDRMQAADLYYGHGTETAAEEARWLLAHALGLNPQYPVDDPDRIVTSAEQAEAETLLERRVKTRKPLAYLINAAWFGGLEFYVDERVIIPRSPVAELIDRGFSPWLLQTPGRILDLCTGAGCIAVACAHRFPEARVDATDISAEALEVAEINVRRHALDARIKLHQADLFAGLPASKYDLIVSNPPYVDADDMADLPVEYTHEPPVALAAGMDGLDVVRRMLHAAVDYLAPGGTLVCEVGNSQPALENAFARVPFTWVELEQGGRGLFVLDVDDLKAGLAG